jgi:prepilin peptidase CpaA
MLTKPGVWSRSPGREGEATVVSDLVHSPPDRIVQDASESRMSEQPVERYLLIFALAVAVVGAVNDVCGAHIPNWLTYGGLGSALAVRCTVFGWVGLKGGLAGLFLAGGIFYFLFLLGGMGGGDVKLMAAVGAWAGTRQAEAILVGSAIAGGILAVWYVLAYRQLGQTLLNTVALLQHHWTSGVRPHPALNIRQPGTVRIPYGLAVAVGTFGCVGHAFWWR